MKIRQTITVVAVLVILFAAIVSGFAETTTSPMPAHHHMGPPPAPAVATDGKYLFVVLGPKIHLYSVPDLTLQTTVDLPKPTPPGAK